MSPKFYYYTIFCIISLVLVYEYISSDEKELVREVLVKEEDIPDFYKQESWEQVYINLKKNKFTGKEIKVAVLDTITDKTSCSNTIQDEKISRQMLHGDKVSTLIKKIAPKIELYCIPVASPRGYVNEKDFTKGLQQAIDLRVDIINMSLGFNKTINSVDSLLIEAYRKNIILVASAGNKGKNSLDFPANSPYVISVGALDSDGVRWEFSNYGNELDFVLPGTSIKLGGEFLEGTSFSTAILTGMIARLKEQYPNSSTQFIMKKLKPSKTWNKFEGYGTPTF
jgi:Subtilase family